MHVPKLIRCLPRASPAYRTPIFRVSSGTRHAVSGQTRAPIVHVMYYHTKEGAKNLAHYAAKAAEAGWQCTVHAP